VNDPQEEAIDILRSLGLVERPLGTEAEGLDAERIRPAAMARLRTRRIVCLCGWAGGYEDMRDDPARCPSCGSRESLDSLEPGESDDEARARIGGRS
jgi:hypothetical protein